jgi:hypothetical protein
MADALRIGGAGLREGGIKLRGGPSSWCGVSTKSPEEPRVCLGIVPSFVSSAGTSQELTRTYGMNPKEIRNL